MLGLAKKRREEAPRELVLPQQGQVVCVVLEAMGAEWLRVFCSDNVERSARIPGKFRRRVWISPGDFVLCSPWDFRNDKADVIYKYEKHEKKILVEKEVVPKELAELAGSS